jgi:hypothetical protein
MFEQMRESNSSLARSLHGSASVSDNLGRFAAFSIVPSRHEFSFWAQNDRLRHHCLDADRTAAYPSGTQPGWNEGDDDIGSTGK